MMALGFAVLQSQVEFKTKQEDLVDLTTLTTNRMHVYAVPHWQCQWKTCFVWCWHQTVMVTPRKNDSWPMVCKPELNKCLVDRVDMSCLGTSLLVSLLCSYMWDREESQLAKFWTILYNLKDLNNGGGKRGIIYCSIYPGSLSHHWLECRLSHWCASLQIWDGWGHCRHDCHHPDRNFLPRASWFAYTTPAILVYGPNDGECGRQGICVRTCWVKSSCHSNQPPVQIVLATFVARRCLYLAWPYYVASNARLPPRKRCNHPHAYPLCQAGAANLQKPDSWIQERRSTKWPQLNPCGLKGP